MIAQHDGAARRTAGIAAPRRDLTEHPPGRGGGGGCGHHRARLLRGGAVLRGPGHRGHGRRTRPRPGDHPVGPGRCGGRAGQSGRGPARPLPRRPGHPDQALRAARHGRGDHRAGEQPDGSAGLPVRRVRASAFHVRPLPAPGPRGSGEHVRGFPDALAYRPAHSGADLGASGHHRSVPGHAGQCRGPVLVRGGQPLLPVRDFVWPERVRPPVRRDVHPPGHDGNRPRHAPGHRLRRLLADSRPSHRARRGPGAGRGHGPDFRPGADPGTG